MSELYTVATWNAANAFDDADKRRRDSALALVKSLDADVLYTGELAPRPENTAEQAKTDDAVGYTTDIMEKLGYTTHAITNYGARPNVRDKHMMAMWSRRPGTIERITLGNRYGLTTRLGGAAVYGIHLDDASEARRMEAVHALPERTNDQPALVMGDFNAMDRHSPGALPWLLRSLSPLMEGVEVNDYYDRSRSLQRKLGITKRMASMASSEVLSTLYADGFTQTDPALVPTCGTTPIKIKIDHILSRNARAANAPTLVPVSAKHHSAIGLSDHDALTYTFRALENTPSS